MALDWRPVTVDDVPAWNALLARSEEVDHTGEHYNEDDLVEELQDEAQGPDDRMGAWDGDQMVAFAAVRPREAIIDHWRIESEGTVDPAYRGRLFTVQTSGLMAIQGVSIALAGVVGSFLAPNLTIAAAGVLGTTTTLLIARQALTTEPRRPATQAL